jgi:hypothetical protein
VNQFAPPAEIAAWLACLGFAVFIFNQAARALYALRGKPTPQEQAERASGIAERVGRLEKCLDACKPEQDRRLAALEGGQKDLREIITEENGKIYKRVNEVAAGTDFVRGSLEIIKTQLNTLISRKG